jgi:hypothetical protein
MRFNTNHAGERIRSATEKIAALRETLLAPSPEALASHVPALEAALHELQLEQLEQIQQDPGSRGGLRRDLKNLASELRVAGKLIEHGIAFEQGWARVLAAATGSYQPDGEPDPLRVRGSISVRG